VVSVAVVRWQELFADLEAQAVSLRRVDDEREIAELTRGGLAQVSLVNRLHAQVSGRLTVQVAGAGTITGQLERVGADWLLLASADEVVVPLPAVMAVLDLPPAAVSDEGVGAVASRLRLTSVLRAIARDRSPVRIVLRDGSPVVGTPDRVGADFVDLAVHEVGEPPRARQVRSRATVSFGSIGCVRRHPWGWD
jgi:hypothetical protein